MKLHIKLCFHGDKKVAESVKKIIFRKKRDIFLKAGFLGVG